MLARAQGLGSVSGLSGWNEQQATQPQLHESGLCQGHMGLVWRIKGTAENTNLRLNF